MGASLVAALIATVLAAVPAAHAAPAAADVFCDVPGQELAISPVDELVEDEPVTALTTVKGTTPTTLSGEYIGKIDGALGFDAHGRPLDLLLVRLSGPEVDRAGIWAGASGSPVYDADGALLGAVAYGFSSQTHDVAGVTPAAYMKSIGELPGALPLSGAERQSVARAVGGDPGQTAKRLKPVQINFGASATQLDRVSSRLSKRFAGFQRVATDARSIDGGVDSGDDLPIVVGGNIAVSYAYGAVGQATVGTVTAVCGDQVFAYGHPNSYDSTLTASFHGATAAMIVPDGGSSYKQVGKIGKRVGTITQDRLAGIRGTLGAYADTVRVTTQSRVGTHRSTAVTHVSEKWLIGPAAYAQLGQDAMRLLDNFSVGSATVKWSIDYRRANGAAKTLSNANRYASFTSFAELLGMDVAEDVAALQSNPFETVTITGVRVSTEFSPEYRAARLTGVQVKQGGSWKAIKAGSTKKVVRGKSYAFRAVLSRAPHAQKQTSYVPFKVAVSKNGKRTSTIMLDALGETDFYDDDFYEVFAYEPSGGTFATLLAELDANVRNDQIAVTRVTASNRGRSKTTSRSLTAPTVVTDGSFSFKLEAPKKTAKKKTATAKR
ncbi:hypothetical protein J4H92_02005 [Leucobacter weissii]|uniref:Peptidase S55 domain-containing protein n=2 Tax=Leucobacter weissii TaxID=1983706 RepID=A0A939MIN4_9MICO|nr:hypothetical protein [Leucobacter weissii]